MDVSARAEVFAGTAALAEELLVGRGVESGPRLADPGFALLHGLYWMLVGLTDLGPLALVVDDAQWADPLSVRFLAFVLKRSDGLPLLVALASRDLPAGEQPGALRAAFRSASVIRPSPLSPAAIGSLLAIEGMTNRQIAETLFITRKTVESHLEHTYRKLGIHARSELNQALAAENQLTTVDHDEHIPVA